MLQCTPDASYLLALCELPLGEEDGGAAGGEWEGRVTVEALLEAAKAAGPAAPAGDGPRPAAFPPHPLARSLVPSSHLSFSSLSH